MSPTYYDRVQVASTTTGTGTYTLGSAITGYRTFAVVGDGNSCHYCAQDVDGSGVPSGDWEVGIGTYTAAGTTLSRDTILSSSNANSAVNWGAGTRRIFITVPAALMASDEGTSGDVLTSNGAGMAPSFQAGSFLHNAVVSLSNAQVIAWPTTPIEIVAAPAAGRYLKFIAGTLSVKPGSFVEYTNRDPTVTFAFNYGGGGSNDCSTYTPSNRTELLLTDGNAALPFDSNQDAQFANYNLAEETALVVKCYNGSLGNFTGGGAGNDGTVIVSSVYLIWNAITGQYE